MEASACKRCCSVSKRFEMPWAKRYLVVLKCYGQISEQNYEFRNYGDCFEFRLQMVKGEPKNACLKTICSRLRLLDLENVFSCLVLYFDHRWYKRRYNKLWERQIVAQQHAFLLFQNSSALFSEGCLFNRQDAKILK